MQNGRRELEVNMADTIMRLDCVVYPKLLLLCWGSDVPWLPLIDKQWQWL